MLQCVLLRRARPCLLFSRRVPSFWCPLSFLGCLLSSVRGLCRLCGPWCLVSPKSLSSFVLPLLLCRSDGTRKSLECEATSGLRLTKRRVARPTPENDLIRKRRVALTAPENYLPNGASCNAIDPNFRLTRKLRCCIRQFVGGCEPRIPSCCQLGVWSHPRTPTARWRQRLPAQHDTMTTKT